jgi:hypothetical protein
MDHLVKDPLLLSPFFKGGCENFNKHVVHIAQNLYKTDHFWNMDRSIFKNDEWSILPQHRNPQNQELNKKWILLNISRQKVK